MIKLDETYSDYVNTSDPKYPAGKAVDASGEDSTDGTPLLAKWMNDINGTRQAIIKEAFGDMSGVSGVPDDADDSDILKALKKITQEYTNGKVANEAQARTLGDADALSSTKSYVDSKVSIEAQARSKGDADALSSTKSYVDSKVSIEAQARSKGDADTLSSAKSYADGQVSMETQARVQGDTNILNSAKSYTDSKILIIQSSVNGETGYIKWNNGLLIQWGTSGSISGQSVSTIYFPISYSYSYSIAGMSLMASDENLITFSMIKKTNSFFQIKRWKGSSFLASAEPVFFIAIGK